MNQSRLGIPSSVIGMIIFIATEVMFFAALISAYFIIRANIVDWPPAGQPRLPVSSTAFNTVILLASGVALYLAGRTQEIKKKLLVASIFLGSFFVLFQGYEWVSLINYGLTMRSSSYGSFFYLIVGVHALHAVVALMALAWVYLKLHRQTLQDSTFRASQLFWFFVVGVWPLLYYLVYLL